MNKEELKPKRYVTVRQIPELYPGVFSEQSIRFLIHKKEENGFGVCMRRLGGKIIIDLDEFEKWIDSKL